MSILKRLISRLSTRRGSEMEVLDQLAGLRSHLSEQHADNDASHRFTFTPTDNVIDQGKQVFGAARPMQPGPAAKTKSVAYILIGTHSELQDVCRNPPHKSTAIIFTGSLVMMADSADSVSDIDQYHRQTDRIVKPLGSITKRSASFTLKVWLHDEAVRLKRALPRHKFCFALDQYLSSGRTKNANVHLITGHSADQTIIHVLTFDGGALTAITEKVLPPAGHNRFDADYSSLLAAYSRNGHSVTVVDPLPRPENENISFVGKEIYSKLISYFIVDHSAAPSVVVRHGISLLIGFTAILLFVASMAIPYDTYSEATGAFQRIAATIPKDDLAFGSDQLKTMQERRMFLTEDRQQSNTVAFLRRLTSALSSGEVTISTLSLNRVKANPTDPDISIVVEMKRQSNTSVLVQAKPVLDRLSERMGMDFHLAHNGHQERGGLGDSKLLLLNIEGTFKGANQ